MNSKNIAAKIIFALITIIGCVLVSIGIRGNDTLVFFGFAFVAAGIMVQVALAISPFVKMLKERLSEKKEEEEEDLVGLGIK